MRLLTQPELMENRTAKKSETKEIKNKHSSRLVRGVEVGYHVREDKWQGSGWQTRQSHTCMQINQEEQLGSERDCTTQGSSMGKESLKTSGCKTL